MTSLALSQACVVGVREMDDQHGILIDTLNGLHLQLVRGTRRDTLNEQIERLVEFTRLHFGCEETLLERYEFPGLAEHRAAHRNLMNAIRHAINQAELGHWMEFERLFGYLGISLLNHIEEFDRRYGAWLNERGVY